MDTGSIWCHAAADVEGSERQAFATALADAGLRVRPPNAEDAESGPAAILVRQVSPALLARVRELSNGGLRRLVALALAPPLPADGWRLLHAGASDVVPARAPAETARCVAVRLARWQAVDAVVDAPATKSLLVGESPAWRRILRQVVEVAHFTDLSVLVVGESGTGKELVARMVHTLDPRPRKRELVLLDCTTVVPELSGSEFFGHERGAFTGAVLARDGAFALANGGTLFLDEVGELPPTLQAELLRVVQEGTFKRVGSNAWQRTAFRLVCATNRDLHADELRGSFRRDFLARIAGWVCRLPPLRERLDDIVPLAEHFWRQLSTDHARPEFDPAVREYLMRYEYRSNVRDLRRLVAAMASRHVGGGPVTLGAVPEHERPAPADAETDDWQTPDFESAIRVALLRGVGLQEIGRSAKNLAVRLALAQADNNAQRAAAALGVSDRAVQQRTAASRNVASLASAEPSSRAD